MAQKEEGDVGGASLTGEAGEVVEDGEFLLWAGLRLPRGGGNNDADSNCVRETRHAAASRVQLALLEVWPCLGEGVHCARCLF